MHVVGGKEPLPPPPSGQPGAPCDFFPRHLQHSEASPLSCVNLLSVSHCCGERLARGQRQHRGASVSMDSLRAGPPPLPAWPFPADSPRFICKHIVSTGTFKSLTGWRESCAGIFIEILLTFFRKHFLILTRGYLFHCFSERVGEALMGETHRLAASRTRSD